MTLSLTALWRRSQAPCAFTDAAGTLFANAPMQRLLGCDERACGNDSPLVSLFLVQEAQARQQRQPLGVSGSSSALLRRRPLRTVRASFPAYGSSLSITPCKSRFNNGKTTATGCVMTFRM